MTSTDAAYLAGLLDGEGCIGVRVGRGGWVRPSIEICMTDRRPLDWAMRVTGIGAVYSCKPDPRGRRRPAFKWIVSRMADIGGLLGAVLPHLQLKTGQARAVLVLAHLRRAKGRAMGPVEHPLAERAIARIASLLKESV